MFSITEEQLFTFHFVDREIFCRLVFNFKRDPVESLLVMAVWLWLEELGFRDITLRLMNQPDFVLKAVADEAALFLQCMEQSCPPSPDSFGGMALTTLLVGKEVSYDIIFQNKYTAINGIKSVLNSVCASIFPDIMQKVLGNQCVVSPDHPLVIPGFPHPVFGAVKIWPRETDNSLPDYGMLIELNSVNNVMKDNCQF
ncbi:uncharacterized protein LOC110810262 [Carica papaya]|uniref:uncharacterized protein LOC110810262 n=1 Tax=Carica papaya TaxID=3649 RepID=UPI000B8D09E6|nr:uncharacterized protein LOC110810262 [Carica papaya]